MAGDRRDEAESRDRGKLKRTYDMETPGLLLCLFFISSCKQLKALV